MYINDKKIFTKYSVCDCCMAVRFKDQWGALTHVFEAAPSVERPGHSLLEDTHCLHSGGQDFIVPAYIKAKMDR